MGNISNRKSERNRRLCYLDYHKASIHCYISGRVGDTSTIQKLFYWLGVNSEGSISPEQPAWSWGSQANSTWCCSSGRHRESRPQGEAVIVFRQGNDTQQWLSIVLSSPRHSKQGLCGSVLSMQLRQDEVSQGS